MHKPKPNFEKLTDKKLISTFEDVRTKILEADPIGLFINEAQLNYFEELIRELTLREGQ